MAVAKPASSSFHHEHQIVDHHRVLPGKEQRVDVYFSADVETDGPIPGPYSMLSFALVYAGRFDGKQFSRPTDYLKHVFYRELRPISIDFDPEALSVNGLGVRPPSP